MLNNEEKVMSNINEQIADAFAVFCRYGIKGDTKYELQWAFAGEEEGTFEEFQKTGDLKKLKDCTLSAIFHLVVLRTDTKIRYYNKEVSEYNKVYFLNKCELLRHAILDEFYIRCPENEFLNDESRKLK